MTTDKKREAEKRKILGNIGEEIAGLLLAKNGFKEISDLNAVRKNFSFADVLAEKDGKRYVISVKTRQIYGGKNSHLKKENTRCHLLYNGGDENARQAAKICHAEAHWLVIQVDDRARTYSAYFGSVRDLGGKKYVSIPECRAGKLGKYLAENRKIPREFHEKLQRIGIFRQND